jgi:excinuclease ABC subunit A
MDRKIIVKGAREHNLKNINVEIPRDQMVVFTGLSGSGKSSLAIDTIYAEGQRRYLQSLSTYARQFLEGLEKPDVDYIEGLSPTIAIEQRTISKNPRSIVATVTESYDYFRLLYANIGIPHCPSCGKEINAKSSQEIVEEVLQSIKSEIKFKILSPVVVQKKGTYDKLFEKLKKSGYSRIIIEDMGHEPIEHSLDDTIQLDKNKKHSIDVIIDRLIMKSEDHDFKTRLANAIETALVLSEGLVKIAIVDGATKTFSEHFFCADCGLSYAKLAPTSFSFNTPYGACEFCRGLGSVLEFDEDKMFPDKAVSLYESGLLNVGGFGSVESYSWQQIECVAKHYKIDMHVPITSLPKSFWDILLMGSGNEKIHFDIDGDRYRSSDDDDEKTRFSVKVTRPWEGIINTLQRRYMQTASEEIRSYYEQFMTDYKCSSCKGRRLRPESLAVTVGGKNIWEVCQMAVSEALPWFENLKLTEREAIIVRDVMKEILARYTFLKNVGLDYITLDRLAKTLSGGEAERIRLATQIGSNLVGVLYVLDEPTIGLHPKDKHKLINMLKELRNKGNSVLIVEHDEDVIRSADHIIDIGPGAGENGGEIVGQGTLADVMKSPRSLTGKYLSGELKIDVPKGRRISEKGSIKIMGAKENNLKNITVEIPLGLFVCITGVSGAGKSSLIEHVLLPAIEDSTRFRKPTNLSNYDKIEGLSNIDKVINIDQTPIGRTPKSVPATYTKLFDLMRDLFAESEEAKIRGYQKGRFSFNVKGGRCEKCQGRGFNLIEMHFLADVYVKCDVCKGKRYNDETLEVRYNGKNIYDVLKMTHTQALDFFKNIPSIKNLLKTVVDVGLGYIELGQSSTTLSGGEAQRMKLSRELSKRATGNTLYILDEPTTGLHFQDIKILIEVLQRLVDTGNTVLVVEHNLDIIKSSDYVIDLGPEGGDKGGNIVAIGTPEDIAQNPNSFTGQYLKEVLKGNLTKSKNIISKVEEVSSQINSSESKEVVTPNPVKITKKTKKTSSP